MSQSCFIPSLGCLGCLHILVIVNNAALDIRMLMWFQISVLGYFGCIPRSGIAGSKGRSIFNCLRYLHTAFHSGCTSLHSYQQCNRVPLCPHPHQHQQLLFVNLVTIAILTAVRWYPIVVLICISLMISEIEHLFRYLLVICISSSEECLFRSFSHFVFGLFVFLVLSFVSTLYILVINPLSDVSVNIVFHSVGCLFILLISFAVQKLFSLM